MAEEEVPASASMRLMREASSRAEQSGRISSRQPISS